jgi:hypothetical protein
MSESSTTDHDRLFKELLTTFLVEFLELFLPEVLAYLDIDSLTTRDKEVFTDVTAGEKFETDILVQARFKRTVADKDSAFFLIHIENQATNQSFFPKRMFRYFARLYEKYDLEVYPIAVFSYDNPLYAAPHQHEVVFPNKAVLHFDYDVIQLNQLKWQDFVNQPNPVTSALMAKMQIAPEERPIVKAQSTAMLFNLGLDEARNQLITGFVETYLPLDAVEEQVFRAELEALIPPQAKENVMQVLNSWTKQGLEQGLEQGKHQGEVAAYLKLLHVRFGQLAPELEAQVEALSGESLDKLAEALFSFSNLGDLQTWLAQQSTTL